MNRQQEVRGPPGYASSPFRVLGRSGPVPGLMAWHVERGLGSSSLNSLATDLSLGSNPDQVIAKLCKGVNALSLGQLGNPAAY